MKSCWKAIGIGCVIGTGIGILPGIGQNASTLISYNLARTVSKTPQEFGHGCPEGISASETSNNATNGGALIPLVCLGIPGDLTTSALIGGLMIHGLQPGRCSTRSTRSLSAASWLPTSWQKTLSCTSWSSA